MQQIEIWNRFCAKKERKLDAIIQFNTGMHRGGLDEKEARLLFTQPKFFKNFNIKYVMSHLACAELKNDSMNYYQNRLFRGCNQ